MDSATSETGGILGVECTQASVRDSSTRASHVEEYPSTGETRTVETELGDESEHSKVEEENKDKREKWMKPLLISVSIGFLVVVVALAVVAYFALHSKEASQGQTPTPTPTPTPDPTPEPEPTPEPTLAPQVTVTEEAANYEKEVLRLVNVERSKEGLQELSLYSKLSQASAIRANELLESFSHTRPSGEKCFSVFKEVGINSYYACGENIAMGQKTPEQVVDAWMNSPGHRANILSWKYRYMGLGFCKTDQGMKYYWAQMFWS